VQIFYVLIALLHMAYGFPEGLMQFVVWLTFVITVVSGVQYMVLWTLKAVHMEDRQ